MQVPWAKTHPPKHMNGFPFEYIVQPDLLKGIMKNVVLSEK